MNSTGGLSKARSILKCYAHAYFDVGQIESLPPYLVKSNFMCLVTVGGPRSVYGKALVHPQFTSIMTTFFSGSERDMVYRHITKNLEHLIFAQHEDGTGNDLIYNFQHEAFIVLEVSNDT